MSAPRREDCENVGGIHEFNPLQYPISTRIPARYDVATAWIGHVPFAMSLVDMIRPRLLVELGTHSGISYCAFCQAVKELRLPTECHAINMWRKEPHAAFYTEEEVFENLKAHHDERYSLFSKLMRSKFDDAVQQFGERSIDLLHIDGCRPYDAVKHDFETWLPKISDRGVVLLHNVDVDRDSFGSWRFWDEVKRKHPHFEFFHSYGLGVLAVGECVPDRLRALIDLSPKDQVLVRQYFANLGKYLTELQGIAIQRANLYELLDAKIEECKHLEAVPAEIELAAMRVQLAAMRVQVDTTMQARSRFRYRIVDRAGQVIGKVPFLPGIIRFTARGIIRLVRKTG
jgi:predicted O-methyltransferase YrrM